MSEQSADAPATVVRMRAKPNGTSNGVPNANAAQVLQRGLEALQEGEITDEQEEIRKLDSQLDHLNDYVQKVTERLNQHNQKLMETLKQQKEEREKRRRSFHERMASSQQEDDDFSAQMAQILNRVNVQRNRESIYDVISKMDVPKVDA